MDGRFGHTAPGYHEHRPPPALARHVRCTWTSWIGTGSSATGRRIVPDGCIDMVWRADAGLLVEGPATGPLLVDLAPSSLVVGVRFQPGMAPSLLGVAADALRDRSVPLEEVWGAAGRELAERGAEAPAASMVAALERALLSRLDDAISPDTLVAAVVERLGHDPSVSVRDLGVDFGVSPRQLLRRFGNQIGYGPRTFARVARFQRFLHGAERVSGQTWSLAALAAEAGYADQAHLSRDCRDLAGLPPVALLASRRTRQPDVRFVQDGSSVERDNPEEPARNRSHRATS